MTSLTRTDLHTGTGSEQGAVNGLVPPNAGADVSGRHVGFLLDAIEPELRPGLHGQQPVCTSCRR